MSKKWLISFFPADKTYVALDHRSLFVTGKLHFVTGSEGKKVKVLFEEEWFEGDVIEQWGKSMILAYVFDDAPVYAIEREGGGTTTFCASILILE